VLRLVDSILVRIPFEAHRYTKCITFRPPSSPGEVRFGPQEALGATTEQQPLFARFLEPRIAGLSFLTV
jgi:hypothetical protein